MHSPRYRTQSKDSIGPASANAVCQKGWSPGGYEGVLRYQKCKRTFPGYVDCLMVLSFANEYSRSAVFGPSTQ